MAYLEQSTRYVPYTDRPDGRLEVPRARRARGASAARALRRDARSRVRHLRAVDRADAGVLDARVPASPAADGDAVYRMTIRAKALDSLRGLLPAATRSNVGIFGTAQGYEALLLRMRAHPLREVRELRRADARRAAEGHPGLPDAARAPRARRGLVALPRRHRRRPPRAVGEPRAGGDRARAAARGHADRLGPRRRGEGGGGRALRRLRPARRSAPRGWRASSAPRSAAACSTPTSARRENRRHKPGRAFERTVYRFDVLGDYGAFRDLQRHRLLTLEWQPLSPRHGWVARRRDRRGGRARRLDARDGGVGGAPRRAGRGGAPARSAPYAVAMAYRVRYLHGAERARGHAHDRAPHRAAGAPGLSAHLPGHAPAHRRAGRPSGPRRRHASRGSLGRGDGRLAAERAAERRRGAS